MKKGKSVMKKMVSLTLSFVLVAAIVMALPQSGLRVQANENPEGTVIFELTYNLDTNSGEVISNYETITTNDGTVGQNFGTITTNNGTVRSNKDGGTVQTNDGTVRDNQGTITINNGSVGANRGGTITTNNSTVTNDTGGVVEKNSAEGTVYGNAGTVNENYGTVPGGGMMAIVTNKGGRVSDGQVTNMEGGSATDNCWITGTMTGGTATDCIIKGTMSGGEAINCKEINKMIGGTATECNITGEMSNGTAINSTIKMMTGGTARGASTVIKEYKSGKVENTVLPSNITLAAGINKDDIEWVSAVSSGATAVSAPEPVIPESPYRLFLTDTAPQIRNAAQGATVELKLGGWNTLPLWFMKEIAARRDMTIRLTYRYERKNYDVVFPAGMVIALDEQIPYYGPLKLADMANRDGGVCNITQ